ncbi:GAF domain-containing protein [Candidatus Woesearchaeota archaeon]|nr:GAF domain-containing protein [Candidatus Woesearchaeota archaeon]
MNHKNKTTENALEAILSEYETNTQVLRILLEQLPLGFAIHKKTTGKAIFINEQFKHIYQTPLESDESVATFLDKVYEKDQQAKEAVMKKLANPTIKNPSWEEFPLRTIDGRKKYITAKNYEIKNTDLILSTVQDITSEVKSRKVNELNETLLKNFLKGIQKEQIYEKIYSFIYETFDVPNMYIAILDKEKQNLKFEYYQDTENPLVENRIIKKGLTEHVIKQSKAQLYNTQQIKKLIEQKEIEPIGSIPKLWLGAPLIINKESKGLIAIQSYDNEKAILQEDLYAFRQLANYISIGLEKNQMIKKIKKSQKLTDDQIVRYAHEQKAKLQALQGFLTLLQENSQDLSPQEIQEYTTMSKK